VRRLPLPELSEGERVLSPEASRYLVRVLRLDVGATVEVFDPRTGEVAEARVISVERAHDRTTTAASGMSAALAVSKPRRPAHAEPTTILVQGYPKGDKLADVVRDATELGATLIVPAICARSVARPDDARSEKKLERLSAVAAEAARQCGRTRAPELVPPLAWAEAIAFARASLGDDGAAFTLFERATEPLGTRLVDAAARGVGVAFAVGPEGGFEEGEVAFAETLGFAPCGLGSTILRTETVAAAVLGALAILRASG
jgi:16S rRNA (uracil1498-N3)-methyltransferase